MIVNLNNELMWGRSDLKFNQILPGTNHRYTNAYTDTRTYFQFFMQYYSGGYQAANMDVYTPGKYYTIFSPVGTCSFWYLKHNGIVRDSIFVRVNNNVIKYGHKYFYGGNVLGCNPKVVGGIIVENTIFIDLTTMYGAGLEPSSTSQVIADCKAIGHDLDTDQPYTAPS